MMKTEQPPEPAAKKVATWKMGCGGIVAVFFGLALIGTLIDRPKPQKANNTTNTPAVAEKRKDLDGFKCLSKWDGSHRKLVDDLKRTLRDPDSFKHIETRLAPSKTPGQFILFMDYRAKNGFGGMAIGKLAATMKQDCTFTIDANVSQ
jgi:hypothetical protein